MPDLLSSIPDFSLANPAYVGALVKFWSVDADGVRTAVLATVYSDATGNAVANNPQILDGDGKLSAAIYLSNPVIAEILNAKVPSHYTGLIQNPKTVAEDAIADDIAAAQAAMALQVAAAAASAATATTEAGIATTGAGTATAQAVIATTEANLAIAAAAGVNLPSIVSGNAGYQLYVKSTEDGYFILPPTTVNVLALLTAAETADVLAGTNADYATINPKIAAAISSLATNRPGSTLDATALHGVWPPGATAWFNTLHTADITLITGRVELQLSHLTSEQFRIPSLMRWVPRGTLISMDGVCSGITSVDQLLGGLVASYNGSSTCTATGTRTLTFASVTGLHVGTRVAIAAGVLDGSMTFTLNGGISNAVTSFSTNETTANFIEHGTEVFLRIDSETLLATSVSGTSFSSVTRGANGSTAASHSNGATIYWKLAQTAKVVSIVGSTVTIDADITEICTGAPVRWGSYRASIEGEMDIDGGWIRYIDGVVTAVAATNVITFTNADATLSDIGLVVDRALYFTNSGGALPAGLTANTTYYIQSVVDLATRQIKVSLTVGGSAVDITDTGTGTHTAHVDRAYNYAGMMISVASEFRVRGKVSIKNNPHGHLMLHGCGDCVFEFDRFQTGGHLITGLGSNCWIFGSNDRCRVKINHCYDSTTPFFMDDKSVSPSTWGLDNRNTFCHVYIGAAESMQFGGIIERSRYCTGIIEYLDASQQGVTIDNSAQSSTPAATDTVGNTIIVYAMNAFWPPHGDAVPGGVGGNAIVLPTNELQRVITFASSTVAANTTADAVANFVGAQTDAAVTVSALFDLPAGLTPTSARSGSTDHVTIRFMNTTAGGLDIAGNYLVTVRNRG